MARSGLKTLHDIDAAIGQARRAVNEVASIPSRLSQDMATARRQQAQAYGEIAEHRLDVIAAGAGGDLGYVDRKAEKLLNAHADEEAQIDKVIEACLSEIEALESQRRKQEKAVNKAVDAYDLAAAKAEITVLEDAYYVSQVNEVERLEATTLRAEEKLQIARDDEQEKGAPFRKDPFFAYLQSRNYGTKQAKGWFLTKMLDGWVARLVRYRQQAENYRRLTAIPARLESHVENLEDQVDAAREKLEDVESGILEKEGVTALRDASLEAQKNLDKIDADIEKHENTHQDLREKEAALKSGQSGPYQEAIGLISDTLKRQNLRNLRRLAAQTRSREDDQAIEALRRLHKQVEDIEDDQSDAKRLLQKHQRSLKELEAVRRRFKQSRYDAPSSEFTKSSFLQQLLGQVLAGVLSGDDFWRQVQRAQRTNRRYSDNDFGGIIWNEGLRLPRSSGGWGGGTRTRRRSTRSVPRRRTSIPRAPRISLPRSSGRSSRSGGFRTGGGF